MKKLINIIKFWIFGPPMAFCIILFFTSCKTREKQVQKTETETVKEGKSSFKIEEKTYEIVFDKSALQQDYSYKKQSDETAKQEKKNIDKGKEYYENGNLKKEWERDLSELSESAKSVLEEISTKLIKEQETSTYWENSSNHFYKALEQEKTKTKDYAMKLKAKETFMWQMFFVGLMIGWIILPGLFRWIWSIIKRFQPYIALVEWIKNLKFKK